MDALVVDAVTGEAMVYRWLPCNLLLPQLQKAYLGYSVPFEMGADGRVIPKLPPCGEPLAFERNGLDPTEVRVLARVPVAPCGSPAPSPSPEDKLRITTTVVPAPVGPVIEVDGRLVVDPSPS
jgi:hypothetical protein